MKIIVTEIQKFADGNITTPSYAFDNQNSADAKFYTILASAALSSVPLHSCIMYTEQGDFIKSKCYHHENAQE